MSNVMDDGGILDLYRLRDDLLIAAAKIGGSARKPVGALASLKQVRPDVDWDNCKQTARDAGWLLINNVPPFARKVDGEGGSRAMFIALTSDGMARAAELANARKPTTFSQRLRALPIGKGGWEIFKLILAAAAGAAAKTYLG